MRRRRTTGRRTCPTTTAKIPVASPTGDGHSSGRSGKDHPYGMKISLSDPAGRVVFASSVSTDAIELRSTLAGLLWDKDLGLYHKWYTIAGGIQYRIV
eukprot:1578389-Rhodomonas_salina.3